MRLLAFLTIALAVGGCAARGAVPAPFPRPGDAPPRIPAAVEPIPDEHRQAIVSTALSLRGVPYRNGGSDPSGFDCSGFVAYVFGQQGHFVPRTVAEQFALGDTIDSALVGPGDLVFFSTTAPGPSHVGIAISAAEFVHAPSSTGVVRVEALGAPYWASRFLAARRP